MSRNRIISLVVLSLITGLGGACFSRVTSREESTTTEKFSTERVSQEPGKIALPSPTGFVNDFANVFDPEDEQRLESLLRQLRSESKIEFAVVTVETTGAQSISDFSLALAKQWGVGPKDTSQGGGLLLMLAIKDRQWRIQVSRGLEKDLPDEVCKELGDQSLDLYRQGRYAEGLRKYVKAIIARLEETQSFRLSVDE